MEKIAIYGKGGIGKSVIATNLSVYYASIGKKVLHVGCDPKHDSSLRLIDDTKSLKTVIEVLGDSPKTIPTEKIVNIGRLGIECCESGGPPPGQGCGGRGVARTIEFLSEIGILSSDKYNVIIFDVLGDIVCGGFAAPLRAGVAQKIFIVISDQPMALYAANNICKAIHTYSANGIVLGGFIVNLVTSSTNHEFLNEFANKLNTKILAFIPKNNVIQEAEQKNKTVLEYTPSSKIAKIFKKLSEDIVKINPKEIDLPTPMDEDEFFEFIKNQ